MTATQWSQDGYKNSAVTITNETMTAPVDHLALGDVNGVANRHLRGILIDPYAARNRHHRYLLNHLRPGGVYRAHDEELRTMATPDGELVIT